MQKLATGKTIESDWEWPPDPLRVIVNGKVDRKRLAVYLIQVCVGKHFRSTKRPFGYSFDVVLSGELKRRIVKFSVPSGTEKMLKISVPFRVSWTPATPGGPSGSCSGVEQIFVPSGK
jgi:hypothetical protein